MVEVCDLERMALDELGGSIASDLSVNQDAVYLTWTPYIGAPVTFAISGLELRKNTTDEQLRDLIRSRWGNRKHSQEEGLDV